MADLYLWHLKWEEEYRKAKKSKDELPWSIWAVKKPSIVEDVPDLLKYYKKPRKIKSSL